MAGRQPGDDDWERLAAEREELRVRLVTTLRALDARAADPLGLMDLVQQHPYVVAGGAAAAGALLVNILVPPQDGGAASNGERNKHEGASVLLETLRDTAVRAVSPWILDYVSEQLRRATPDAAED